MDKTLEQCYETLGLSIDATKGNLYMILPFSCLCFKNRPLFNSGVEGDIYTKNSSFIFIFYEDFLSKLHTILSSLQSIFKYHVF